MSFKTRQARQRIVGLLRNAAAKTMTYEQLDEQTDGIPTDVFNEALADMVAAGEVREKDGSYTLLELQPEHTAPSTAARRTAAKEAAEGIPPSARETKVPRSQTGWNRGQFPAGNDIPPGKFSPESRRRGGDEVRAKIITLLTNAPGTLPKQEILEGIENAVTRRGLDYLVGEMVKDGRLARLGSKSNPKYTTASRRAECQDHLDQLQARDLHHGDHRHPTPNSKPAAPSKPADPPSQTPAGDPAMSDKNDALVMAVRKALIDAGEPLKLSEIVAACKGSTAFKVKKVLATAIDGGAIIAIGKGRACRYGMPGGDRPAAPASAPRRGGSNLVGKELAEAADEAQQAFEAFIFSRLSKEQQKQLQLLRDNRDNARRLAEEWQS